MQEFIEELKHNQKINIEKGLENRVDIDYVIERLEDISPLESYLRGEISFVIENLINDNYMEQENKEDFEKVEKLNDKDIEKIHQKIINNKGFIDYINEIINNEIEDTIFHYIHKEDIVKVVD